MSKKFKKIFEAFQYEELSEKAKERVINDCINTIIEEIQYDEETRLQFKDAIEESVRMHTPWFLGDIILEKYPEIIMKECNSYLYLENGEYININDMEEV